MRLVKGLLERCVEVVELLSAAGAPLRLSDIAQRLDLPKGAAHRLLQELCALGWAAQDGAEGPYRLTLRFGLLGNRVVQASGLPDLTQPVLERLAAATRELVRLTVATGDGLAWVGSAQGAPPGLVYQPAMDGPLVLHATANGKAYLATLEDAAALALARRSGLGAARPTPRTLADERALIADLQRVRRRGYALAEEEAELGVTAVAVAVTDARGAALGTVSVAGPSLRLPKARIPDLAASLAETARVLASVWPARAGPLAAAATIRSSAE
ncbi:MAG: IclR family transcriptional regulator [Proteobacteria bacterium]|nr:IclR family transcriptional regulator [Pseudomonadota bacterium]